MHNVHLMPNPVTQPYPGLPSTQDSREPFDGIWHRTKAFVPAAIKALILLAVARSRLAAARPVFRDAWRQRPDNRLGFAA